MTPTQKLELIESKIKNLNEVVFKCKNWNIAYENKGANNYCLNIVLGKEVIYSGKYATYSCVLSTLEFLEVMFSRTLEEKQKKVGKK